jgi:spindle assembly abnormal protein 6
LKLTDTTDPFFLWQTVLTEEDYGVLRREQNLLIDFSRFPMKLIELFQQCAAHIREQQPTYTTSLLTSVL